MIIEELNKDVAKEILTVLFFCDNAFTDRIPSSILKQLNDLAADSKKEINLDKNKVLAELDLSDECKDFLSILYFTYMSDSNEKQEIFNIWLNN